MTSHRAISNAKHALEKAERKLIDARNMREKLTLQLPKAPVELQPVLRHALDGLIAATPRLEEQFGSAHDVLRALTFVRGLDGERISIRSAGTSHAARRYVDKRSRSRAY